MNKENGFTYRFIVIVVIIIIALAGVVINKLLGEDGVVETVTSVETSFSKEDVLDKLNVLITHHFVEVNNQAKENNQVISDVYSSELVIKYLKECFIIEEIYNENNEVIADQYKVNISNLYENDGKSFFKTGEYYVVKEENSYKLIYKCEGKEDETIGELQIQQV